MIKSTVTHENHDFVLLTGTPGIGKSVFRDYVLVRLLMEAPEEGVPFFGAAGRKLAFVADHGTVCAFRLDPRFLLTYQVSTNLLHFA